MGPTVLIAAALVLELDELPLLAEVPFAPPAGVVLLGFETAMLFN